MPASREFAEKEGKFMELNLFDMLGIPTPKEETKPEKKKKSRATKSASKKDKENAYPLPLTVVTGWHEPAVIEGPGEVLDQSLRMKIHELFPEYTDSNMTIHVDSDKKSVYVGFKRSSILTKGTQKLASSVECCLGGERLEISNAFDGTDDQEVDVADISKVLAESCPIFKGCSFVMGEILVPMFTQSALTDQKLSFPINILFFGRGTMQVTKQQYAVAFSTGGQSWDEEDGTVSAVVLMDIVLGQWNDLDARFTVLEYDQEQNMVLVTQIVGEEETKKTPVKDEFSTEGTTLSVIFQKLPLSPELFGGKTSVTKKELQAYVAGIFPEYGGNNVEFLYNKETKFIVPLLRGSSKGGNTGVS